MQHAQKMILVNPDTVGLTSVKDRPTSSESLTRTRLDQELKDILDRTDLDSYDKLQLYNQVLQRYLTFYNRTKQPMTVKLIGNPLTTAQDNHDPRQDDHQLANEDNTLTDKGAAAIPSLNDTKAEKLMANFPITLKKKAHTLLEMIRNSKGILDFNEGGELLVDGHVISGSHISDLIYDALIGKSGFEPRGMEQFLAGMVRLNVPERLIRNKSRRLALRRMKQTTSPRKSTRSRVTSIVKAKKKTSTPKSRIKSKRAGHLTWESYT